MAQLLENYPSSAVCSLIELVSPSVIQPLIKSVSHSVTHYGIRQVNKPTVKPVSHSTAIHDISQRFIVFHESSQ